MSLTTRILLIIKQLVAKTIFRLLDVTESISCVINIVLTVLEEYKNEIFLLDKVSLIVMDQVVYHTLRLEFSNDFPFEMKIKMSSWY